MSNFWGLVLEDAKLYVDAVSIFIASRRNLSRQNLVFAPLKLPLCDLRQSSRTYFSRNFDATFMWFPRQLLIMIVDIRLVIVISITYAW